MLRLLSLYQILHHCLGEKMETKLRSSLGLFLECTGDKVDSTLAISPFAGVSLTLPTSLSCSNLFL